MDKKILRHIAFAGFTILLGTTTNAKADCHCACANPGHLNRTIGTMDNPDKCSTACNNLKLTMSTSSFGAHHPPLCGSQVSG